jgi:hypothetical protein
MLSWPAHVPGIEPAIDQHDGRLYYPRPMNGIFVAMIVTN